MLRPCPAPNQTFPTSNKKMKNKIVTFATTGKLAANLRAKLPEHLIFQAATVNQIQQQIDTFKPLIVAFVIELIDDEGWTVLEYVKTRLYVENLTIPVFGIINSIQIGSNTDSPFIEDPKSAGESDLAKEFGVEAVVLDSKTNETLIPLLQLLDFEADYFEEQILDSEIMPGITFYKAWYEINQELLRINSELLQNRSKNGASAMISCEESLELGKTAKKLKQIRIK